jgi:cell division inhibitor SepF
MGTWRKAGVWLGLVEDDEDRDYVDDELDAFDEDFEPPARPRGRASVQPAARSERVSDRYSERASDRSAERMAHSAVDRTPDRAPVRSFPRVDASYASEDNLALAPQVVPQVMPSMPVKPEEPSYRITTMHPTTYNEARTIGEHFRNGVPVIMNLTEMTEADARRLVDFCAGLTFGLRGSIDRVTNRVFLLSPADIEVTAEDKAKIAEGGFFNQS